MVPPILSTFSKSQHVKCYWREKSNAHRDIRPQFEMSVGTQPKTWRCITRYTRLGHKPKPPNIHSRCAWATTISYSLCPRPSPIAHPIR